MPGELGIDRRGVTPAVTHVLTISMTAILVMGLLAAGSGFLDSEKQSNARAELEMIGHSLADEVSRIDTLARDGGRTSAITTHPIETSGGRYSVLQYGKSECHDGDACLKLWTHEIDAKATVPLRNETRVTVDEVGPGKFNVTGVDPDPSDDAEDGDPATGLTLRAGIAGDVGEDPLGTRLTARNEPPVARFDVDPEPPTTAEQSFLNASGSYDADGNVSQYVWDVGNDGLFTERGEVAPYWFDEPGRYEIELRTTDDADDPGVDSTTNNVTVSGLEYQADLREGDHTESIRYSFYNNWSDPIRLDSIFVDGPDHIDELGDCDDDYHSTDDFESEINIDTDSDLNRDYYFEVDDDSCSGALDIPESGLIFDVDQQPGPSVDIDTNVDNEHDDVPVVQSGEYATIELAGLDDDLDGDWRLGVGYIVGGLSSETVFGDRVEAPHVSDFAVEADGGSLDVTLTADRNLGTLEVEFGKNETIDTLDLGDFDETTPGGDYVYTAEDIVTDASGRYWAEPNAVAAGGIEAYDLPDRDSTVLVDDDAARWQLADDWDNNTVDSGVVHETFGDRVDDTIGLGYPTADRGDDGLVAYWPMDHASNMEDESELGIHDASTTDVVDEETVGLFGTTSYAFTGSESVTVPSSDHLSGGEGATITVSAWIHPRAALANSNGSAIVGKLNDTTGGDWSLVVRDDCPGYADGGCDGTPTIGYYGGTETNEYGLMHGPITDADSWHHVAFVMNETEDEVSLYYDGRLEERVTNAPEFVTANTTQDVVLGEHPATGDNFDGYVDETRVYSRTLSDGEVLQLYETSERGAFTTDWVNTSSSLDADTVNLSSAVDLDGGSATVTVVSDEGEESAPIRLRDGDHDYQVSGLTAPADGWQLEVELESASPITTPEIDALVVHDDP